ncbi:unnamed protein product [Rotaria sp. Silwood2]|nr:unnamed protein product [Rotaria sp. Silwood2]CAF4245778.1 unnamed protein product [Rotaria sp. Silwood2]CAF4285767.1 unnamed protein product [Rotaria sp. Silwood2]
MAALKRRINTSLLPDDVLSYTDTQFYNVAKQIVGDNAVELLEIQGVRSPDSLVLIPDVFAILDIKCAALNSLKEKLCLKSDDDTYVVKPGIKSLMNYFCELIIKKKEKDVKISSKQKGSTSIISSLTPASYVTNGIPSTQQQQLSSSTMPMDENYHRNFIINSINNWCQKYSSKLCLTEGVDYHLFLTLSDDRSFTAKIKCGCGSKIGLVKLGKKFQMSNFYKHLASLLCTTIAHSKGVTISNQKDTNEIDLSDNDVATRQKSARIRSESSSVAKKKRSYQN